MNKKGATSLAVALLVVATLIFSVAILVILSEKKNKVVDTFHIPYSIEDVYVLEEQVKFYLANGGSLDKVKEFFGSQSLVIEINGKEITATEYAENMIIKYKFEV